MSILFPKWMNFLPTLGAVAGVGGFCAVVGGFWYYATPSYWEVGFMPTQPGGGFNHQLHAGTLGIDCRYCHSNVEVSAEANIPHVRTCMGCHAEERLAPEIEQRVAGLTQFIRDAYEKNESIPWRRVHKLPDYVRNFPHNVHVKAGVSCFSCHGQIAGMPVVYQAQSLSMSWCLDCHRSVDAALAGQGNPALYLVPPERVTQLKWVEDEWLRNAQEGGTTAHDLLKSVIMTPPENCGACHY